MRHTLTDVILGAMAQGATQYEIGTYDWYFITLRPIFRRRWLLFGEREHVGWEKQIHRRSVPAHDADPIPWFLVEEWHPVSGPGSGTADLADHPALAQEA